MEFCWDARPPSRTTASETVEPQRPQEPTAAAASRRQRQQRSAVTIANIQEHATAIQNINVHLREQHIATTATERAEVVEYCRRWPTAAPQKVILPPPLGSPIEELGEPLDAFQCTFNGRCSADFYTVSKAALRMHLKREHQQSWKGDLCAVYRSVKVQTFFRTAGLQRYFPVDTAARNRIPSEDTEDAIQTWLAEWDLTRHAHREKIQVMETEVAKTDRTGWFKRTGWLEHFAGRNLVHLAHQARRPDRREVRLQRAAELVELLVERSVKGLSTLARGTRRWLRSAKRQEIDPRPLARLQNPESQARYAGYMVKSICYALRLIADDTARGQDTTGAEDSESDVHSSSSADATDDGNSSGGSSGNDGNDRNSGPLRHRRGTSLTPLYYY